MTETTTTELVPAGTVLQVDPNTLVLAENIRTDVHLPDAFVESIREHGVRVPLDVQPDALGQLLIIDGQRRYLAALRTEQATVPVVLTDGIGDDESRITEQWLRTEHRAPLTKANRAAVVEQLSLFGRNPKAIAKKLGMSREEVDAAQLVAQAPNLLQAVTKSPDLDLLTAARIAEFAGDKDVLAHLTKTALERPERLEYQIVSARQDAAVDQARDARAAEFTAAGVHVLEGDEEGEELGQLSATPADGTAGPPAITVEEHAACPHRAVFIEAWWVASGPQLRVDEVCLDPEAAGHHVRYAHAEPEVDEEAKKAAASAERKHVIAQGKASDAAQELRRRFIVEQLLPDRDAKGRIKAGHAGVVQHAASIIEAAGGSLDGYQVGILLSEWSDGKTMPDPRSSRPAAERALLHRVLAVGEAEMHRDFWRDRHYAGYSTADPVRVRHLRYLAARGYDLAPIEEQHLQAWDAAVTKQREADAKRAAERDTAPEQA